MGVCFQERQYTMIVQQKKRKWAKEKLLERSTLFGFRIDKNLRKMCGGGGKMTVAILLQRGPILG